MKNFRILKNQQEACLISLKIFFGMLDDHTIACLGAFELFFEGGNPDLFLFLDDEDGSEIVDATDQIIIVQYELDGETVIGEIGFSEIARYSDMIADTFQEGLNIIGN